MQPTGGGAASRAEDDEVGALALIPMHRPLLKRQKTVRTVSALLLPVDAGGAAASGTHLAIAAVTEVGPPERDKTDGPLGLNDVWVREPAAFVRLYYK